MPSYLFYILMGALQGMFEWLPISSEGQLTFISVNFFSISPQIAIRLALWLHFGTLLAVLIKYRDEWLKIVNISDQEINYLRRLIIFSTLGTAITGVPVMILLFSTDNQELIAKTILWIIAIALLVTSVLLYYVKDKAGRLSLGQLSNKQMLLVGLMQGLSIIPGISRSGTTVSALIFLKVNPKDSFKGSFLISVPAVLGAVTLDILFVFLDGEGLVTDLNVFGIILAITMSFVLGYLSMEILLRIAKQINFALIVFVLAIIMLGFAFVA